MATNLQKYIALLEVIDQGSITKAAQTLRYSQSALSRMIQDLEREWGMALLERSRAGVRPTSDALKLLPHVRILCADRDRLLRQVDELRGLRTGLIRIGTFSSVATHWLPNVIAKFQAEHPNVDFELLVGDYGEIENWVDTGRVDLGFLILPAMNPNLETSFLYKDDLLAILPEGHPLEGCDRFPIAALREYPFILLTKGVRSEVSDLFERYHMAIEPTFTTLDDYVVMSMVEKGLGIAVLPRLILRRSPYHIVVKELDVPASRLIGLAFRSRSTLTVAARRFLDYFETE